MKIFHFSQQGHRPYQEDSYYIDEETKHLFVICDGVGGHAKGDIASNTVVEYIKGKLSKNKENKWEVQDFQSLFHGAQDALQKVQTDKTGASNMGTTVVLFFLSPLQALTAHVGDSRAYVVKPAESKYWRTKDHSLVQELLDAGVLKSESAMEDHPMRNRITRALQAAGGKKYVEADVATFDGLEAGDYLLLCSDGVLEPFPSHSFIDILADVNLSFEEKGETIRKACEAVSKDNNTCILIQIEETDQVPFGTTHSLTLTPYIKESHVIHLTTASVLENSGERSLHQGNSGIKMGLFSSNRKIWWWVIAALALSVMSYFLVSVFPIQRIQMPEKTAIKKINSVKKPKAVPIIQTEKSSLQKNEVKVDSASEVKTDMESKTNPSSKPNSTNPITYPDSLKRDK